MHEAQVHKANSFITLTYADEHLSYGNTQPTLYKPDLQNFWKRLRKELKKQGVKDGIRYFACGEYGSQRSRPHFHACLFGYDFPDKTLFSTQGGNNLHHSRLLDSVWTHGHCSVGELTAGSAAYVARYILDKGLGDERQTYSDRGIEPEYVVMSRRPGIGASWFSKFAGDIYPKDRILLDDGSSTRPPRYYDELRKIDFPQEIEKIKLQRMELAENRAYEEKSAKRMLGKIRFHESRVKNFQKKLHT